MKITLTIINSLLCIIIGGFHLYWGYGGNSFTDRILPKYPHNFKPQLINRSPNIAECYLIFVAFLVLAVLLWLNFFNIWYRLIKILLDLAILLFFLRTIGDFNAAGLFKREHSTLFGYWDTHLYTPLCIWFTISILIIVLLS